MIKSVLVGAVLFLMSPFAFAHEFDAEGIRIDHPWARPTVTTRQPAAVFFHLENRTGMDDRLIGVEVDPEIAGGAELHTTLNDEGILRMRPLANGILVPAGESVPVAPGGYHVMLFQLSAALEEGARFPLTLIFEAAGAVPVEVVVEVPDEGAPAVDHTAHH